LQQTVFRFLKATLVEEIVISTNIQYLELVKLQLAEFDSEKKIDILVEPFFKNTAPAIALGVKYLQEKKGAKDNCAILVAPCDHWIENPEPLLTLLSKINDFAKEDKIILFGIYPTDAKTGYGYIQIGQKQKGPCYSIEGFIEKPEKYLAEQYLAQGGYYWNAGMFLFCPRTFWTELAQCAPEIYQKMQGGLQSGIDLFEKQPRVSIDYAILEKTKKISLCPLAIKWNDLGCWDSIYESLPKDQNENVKIGDTRILETKNSLIIGNKKTISTIGVEDLIIICSEDKIFISKRGNTEGLKKLSQELINDA